MMNDILKVEKALVIKEIPLLLIQNHFALTIVFEITEHAPTFGKVRESDYSDRDA
jgi:hypothetical protein